MLRRNQLIVLGCLAAALAPSIAASTPGRPASLTATERAWRHRVLESVVGNGRVSAARAAAVEQLLRHAVVASGGQIVRLIVRRGPEPAPEIVIRASRPAGYLKHALPQVLRRMPARWAYLRVVDGRDRRALEWAFSRGPRQSEGVLYVPRRLEGCSPIAAFGWPSPLPACPSS